MSLRAFQDNMHLLCVVLATLANLENMTNHPSLSGSMKDNPLGPLPDGWEEATTEAGDKYFIEYVVLSYCLHHILYSVRWTVKSTK